MVVRLASANLRYGMTPRALTRAGRILSRRAGIIGFQELRNKNDRAAVQKGLGPGFGWVEGGQCSQAYRKARWVVLEHQTIIATGGVAGVTPDLPITRVVYQDRKNPALKFVVYDTHLVPLSLHGRRRPEFNSRKQLWDGHWLQLKAMVADDIRKNLTVFVLGDFNNIFAGTGQATALFSRARWLKKTALDWILVIEGSVRVRKIRSWTVRTGSDHAAVGVTVRLSRKA